MVLNVYPPKSSPFEDMAAMQDLLLVDDHWSVDSRGA